MPPKSTSFNPIFPQTFVPSYKVNWEKGEGPEKVKFPTPLWCWHSFLLIRLPIFFCPYGHGPTREPMLGRSQKQESPETGQWSPAVGRWACPTKHHPAAHTWAKEALNLLLSRELCLKLGHLPLYDIMTKRTYNASPPLPSGLCKERVQK